MRRAWLRADVAFAACLLGVAYPALPAPGSTAADLARCVKIVAEQARLACYDALAGRTADPAAALAATGIDAISQTPATAPAPVNTADPANFGLTEAQLHSTPQGPASIKAQVAKIIEGRPGGSRGSIVLDNGQTWNFIDPEQDRHLRPGDPVTIKRAALGSFMMMTPSRRSYHVRRVQ